MRRDVFGAVVTAVLLIPASLLAQQQSQNQTKQSQPSAQAQGSQPSGSQGTSSQSTTLTPVAPEDPLAAAARKAREQKKDQMKPARVFDNDNIPKQGGISSVGSSSSTPSTASAGSSDSGASSAAGGPPSAKDEKGWRDKFAKLRHKLDEDQQELALMQRELGVLDVQYYNSPMEGMQQGLTRSDINEKTDKIEAKKKQIEADQQAISDGEEQLRQAGGDPGWAR
ncbi:MAG: hypothetical protein WB630_01085 [Candidatus Acidiferrales bacterium]